MPLDPYWSARSVAAVTASLAPLEGDWRWEEALQRITALFREDVTFFEGAGTPALADYQRVLQELDVFAVRLSAALSSSTKPVVDGATRFRVAENQAGGYRLLDGEVVIPETATVDRARSLCLVGHSVRRFHDRLTVPARLAGARDLHARVKRWDTFNERGLTPFPWELALNEAIRWFGTRQPLEPPRLQLIALRPSAAFEVDRKLGDRVNVLAVEVAGVAWYFGGRGAYLAASALMVSPSEAKTGWGAMFRIAPWMITGGPEWRDVDGDGKRDRRWVLSVDAFDMLSGAPKSLVDAARLATGGRTRP